MEVRLNLGFEQIFSLANQLPKVEKERLIAALRSTIRATEEQKPMRQLGKFKGQIWMADDFNAPLDDFQEYM